MDALSSVNFSFKRQTYLFGTPYCAVHLYSQRHVTQEQKRSTRRLLSTC